MVRWSPRFAGAYVLTALAWCVVALAVPSTDFRVDKINQMSSVRFGRDQFDYTYTIDVTNTGPARAGVRATVTSRSSNTVILDGSVTLGDVAASASLRSTDTFSFRQNRTVLFNPSDLQWTFEHEPPLPPPNREPVINSSPVTTATVGLPYEYDVNATDPDGDNLTYSLTTAPSGLTIDAGSGLLVWSPSAAQEGPNAVAVRVADGRGGAVQQLFMITVAKPNTPPTIDPIPERSVVAGQTVQFSVHGADADGDSLTHQVSPEVANATLSATGDFSLTPALSQVGDISLTFTVSDGKASASTSTVVHVRAPNGAPTVTSTPIASAREGDAYSYDVDATDPEGDALTYSLTEAPAGVSIAANTGIISWTPSTVQVGKRHFIVRVIDGQNGAAEQAFDVVVTAAVDRTRPIVQLSAPLAVTTGTEFTVHASAADNVAVTSVTWFVDDAQISVQTSGPYSVKYVAAQTAGAKVTVRAIAKDAAGNAGEESADVLAVSTPDTTPPVIDAILVPPTVAPGETITVRAIAHDDRGIDAVTLSVESVSIGTPTAPPYEVQYTVPSGAAIGSAIVVHVTARDAAGNEASAEASMQVVGTADTAAPTGVTVTSPATTLPGQTIQIQASALDDVGILKVVFLVDGVPFAEVTSAPYQVTYEVPADAPAGSQLVFTAVAYDFKSQATSSPAAFPEVVAGTQGVVLTEVYDDSVGLPLAGVTVSVLEVNGKAPVSPITAVSDSRGRVRFDLSEGQAVLELTKPDFTRAVRTLVVAGNSVNEAFDARLRPRGAGRQVNPIAGTTLTMEGITARFDPGAVTGLQTVSITALGGQALPSPLPLGWSPVAAFELAPVALKSNATIAVTLSGTFQAADIVAQWNDAAREWRRIDANGSGGTRAVQISELGALAVVRADIKPAVAASPAVGQALAGVTPVAIPTGTAAQIEPSPDVLFMQPGARSEVATFVAGAGVVPSGTPVEVSFDELYERTDDTILRPDSNRQDLLLYAVSGGANADFRASPSQTFDPTLLRKGTIKLAAQRRAGTDGSAIIGPAGGTVTASGASVVFPAGALENATPVRVTTLTTSAATSGLPSGFTPLGGITIDAQSVGFGASVDTSVTLSTPVPPGATLLWVHPVDLGSLQALQLVAIGENANGAVRGGKGALGLAFPGFYEPGDYLLISSLQPMAFATGHVQMSGGDAGRAIISAGGFPASVASSGQEFAVAIPTGPQTLGARSSATAARASESINAAAGQVVVRNLTLTSSGFAVLSTIPADGASAVSATSAVVLYFSDRVAPESVTTTTVRLVGPSGPLQLNPAISADHRAVTLQPESPLAANQSYSVTVASSLQSEAGTPLGLNGTDIVVSRFVTQNPAAPAADAALVSAAIPRDGLSAIHGGPGAVEPGALVGAIDSQSGLIVTAIARSDGSFDLSVPSTVTSRIRLMIRGAQGTHLDLGEIRFQDADGTVVVGSAGGTVRSADGAEVSIPAGALVDGTLLRIQSVPAASVDAGAPEYPVLGALSLDFGWQRAQAPLALSIPAPPGLVVSPDDVIIVVRVFEFEGQNRYQIVNQAHLTDDGRLQNGAPGFVGTLASGTYAFLREELSCTSQPCADWVQVVLASSYDQQYVALLDSALPAGFTPFAIDLSYVRSGITRVLINRSYEVKVRSSFGQLVKTLSFDGGTAIPQGVIQIPAPDDGQSLSILRAQPAAGAQNTAPDAPLEILFNKSISALFDVEVTVRRPGSTGFVAANGTLLKFQSGSVDGIRFTPQPEGSRLLLGAVYRVEVSSVCEFGHLLQPQYCMPSQEWEFSTVVPEILGEVTGARVPPAVFYCPPDRFAPREITVVDSRWIAVANTEISGTDPCRGVVLIDASNVAKMVATTQAAQAALWSVSSLPRVDFNPYKVDTPLVVATHGGRTDFGFAVLYTVTPSGQLVKLGSRGLSSSADSVQSGVILPQFPPLVGAPVQIKAVAPRSAFIANIGIGLQAMDLVDAIAGSSRPPTSTSTSDEFAHVEYFTYLDARSVAQNRLIMLGDDGIYSALPELVDSTGRSTLRVIAQTRARTVLPVSNYTYDEDQNSQIDPIEERFDFLLAATATGGLWRLDPLLAGPAGAFDTPQLLFKLPGNPVVQSLAVDRYRRLLYVGTNQGLQVFDFSRPVAWSPSNVGGVVDTDHDGMDDRLLFTFDQSSGSGIPFVRDLKMGSDETTLFVASDRVLSIGFNSCPVQYISAELRVTPPGQSERAVRSYAGPACRKLEFTPQNVLNPPHLKIYRNDIVDLSNPEIDAPPATFRVSVRAMPAKPDGHVEALAQDWKNVAGTSPLSISPVSSVEAIVSAVPYGVSQVRLHVDEDSSTALTENSDHDLVIVKPLAGAEVSEVVRFDLARAAVFARHFKQVYGPELDACRARGSPTLLGECEALVQTIQKYFWQSFDYIGMALGASPLYNADNAMGSSRETGNLGGYGGVYTWFGVPIRSSKVTNVLAAFVVQRIGIEPSLFQAATLIFSAQPGVNDPSSNLAYALGQQLADDPRGVAGAYEDVITPLQLRRIVELSRDPNTLQDPKEYYLWPNTEPATNKVPDFSSITDVHTQFASPQSLVCDMDPLGPGRCLEP